MNDTHETLKVSCIAGGPASGKTECLARKALRLARTEPPSGTVLFAVASPKGKAAARRSLIEAGSPGSPERLDEPDIEVLTVQELALRILKHPGAQAVTGRKPRLLERWEERFLDEDLKACALKPRRLRELKRFIARGISDLSDDEPDWIQTKDERLVYDTIKDSLDFMQGIWEPELAGLALRVLRKNADAKAAFTHPSVFADDFCCLSKGMQSLIVEMAGKTLYAAGDPGTARASGDSYPNERGLDDLRAVFPHASSTHLDACRAPRGIDTAIEALRVGRAVQVEGALSFMIVKNPDEERAAIVDAARGFADKVVAIACPNAAWRSRMLKELRDAGLDVRSALPASLRPFKGDLRDATACRPYMKRTLQRLVVDPEDGVAWRCWIGFGDYLGRSVAVRNLRIAPERAGRPLHQMLALLSENPSLWDTASFPPLRARRDDALNALCDIATIADDAPHVCASSKMSTGRIVLCDPQDLMHIDPDVVILGGFVDGIILSRDYFDPAAMVDARRRKELLKAKDELACALGRARSRAIIAGFTSCPLEEAERLDLSIKRITLEDGARICIVSPSILLKAETH